MKKTAFLPCFLLASLCALGQPVWAQGLTDDLLHVVKSSINAESDNAEFCLEFDKSLPAPTSSRLSAALSLEEDGKHISPPNIMVATSSLCLSPLERGHTYQLTLTNLRSAQNEKLAAPYVQSFTVPDRSPLLAFTGANGGVNGFGAYESPLTLRAINVPQAQLDVYHITDTATMLRVWQDRAQTTLVPSESVYVARNKGQQAWQSNISFDAEANDTVEESIPLREKLPDLTPGLYLIIASTGDMNDNGPASNGLAPLTAAWFTKSDFTLRAIRDSDGIHVFASTGSTTKGNIHLVGFGKKPEPTADMHMDGSGIALLKPIAASDDITTVIGTDDAGNVAFADVESLPALASLPALGSITLETPFVTPGDTVNLAVSLAQTNNTNDTPASIVRVARNQASYMDAPVPALAKNTARLSFPAPMVQGVWDLHWQKNDGTVLANASVDVTTNADTPHLTMQANVDTLNSQTEPEITIHSVTSGDKAAPLIGGRLTAEWQPRDPAAAGWKNYAFGIPANLSDDKPLQIGDFLTDMQGKAQAHFPLPKAPPEPGLYQAVLTATAESDQGVAAAPPLILPLHPEGNIIGIKPSAPDARFPQNSMAQFALIGLSGDEKPHDIFGLAYQVYEEGRSFDWYQADGRWNYKRDPQLRPIGGGADLSIKADGSSVLEWPVTAGNYRLEIIDTSGKVLAQTAFSAGWNSSNATTRSLPLAVIFPKMLQPGHEAVAHFTLPVPAMITALVADAHIRKTIHEFRPKGDNTVSFMPGADWQNGVSLTIEATAAMVGQAPVSLRAVAQATLADTIKTASDSPSDGASLLITEPVLIMRKDGKATLTVGLENNGSTTETYAYTFSAAPGLSIDAGEKGSVTVGAKQSRSLSILVNADQVGGHEIKLDITGAHATHLTHSWPVAVLSSNDFLKSGEVTAAAPQQALLPPALRAHSASGEMVAFIAKHSTEGLGETLSYVFNAHPFTSSELAAGVEALRLWQDTLAQTGTAPETAIAAQRQEWLMRLMQHQNADGGFARLRDGDSTMADTAAALLALGPDTSDKVRPTKILAVNWIKQHLANTWFDEKERTPRAAAYAGLAAADAIDASSLRYFSDTSATNALSPVADANIAAAFKHIRDPNAAAFWIKKMLDENGPSKGIALLSALAATDALSSDDVHAVLRDMADTIRHGTAPDFTDAALLLRAVAADNSNAGAWRLNAGNQTHDVSGVYVAHLSDPATANLHNGGNQPVTISLAAQESAPAIDPPAGSSIARHVYRLNGVEVSPQTKPVHSDIYMVELTGKTPITRPGEQVLVHDSAATAIQPVGCVLSFKLDGLSFIPWFTPRDLTPIGACEMRTNEINALLAFPTNENRAFRTVYFAHLDAKSVSNLPAPRIRVIKN